MNVGLERRLARFHSVTSALAHGSAHGLTPISAPVSGQRESIESNENRLKDSVKP